MYISYNPHPTHNNTGDCVIRAITKVLGIGWDDAYLDLMLYGFSMKDWPDSNHVWGSYLLNNGFRRYPLQNTCPDCYTVRDFCEDHPHGTFVLATGSHVIAVIDGDYYDSWDSGNEVPAYVFVMGDQ